MNPPEKWHRVETPDDYYQKELDAYYHWRFAWGREIGQNSIDAGAKNITIKITDAPGIKKQDDSQWTEDTCWVEWIDDGVGMDRDDGEGGKIVFSKYLVLGASHKKDGDTGGFGWAKKLICFAMIEWHIRTGTLHIHGKGGSYWVEDGLEWVDGTAMKIRVPAWSGSIGDHIKKWCYWTDTKGCKITLNGEDVPTFSSVPVRGSKPTGIDWARLTVTDILGQDIIIRANGQMMSKMTGPNDQKFSVIVDVLGKSQKHFTSNRDALRQDSKNEISSFINQLFKNPNRISKLEEPILSTYKGKKGGIDINCDSSTKMSSLLSNGVGILQMLAMMKLAGDEDEGGDVSHDGFDIHIHNEMEGRDVPSRFLPGTWTKKNIKLMAQLCAIIKFVGDVIGYEGTITPGWVFSPDVDAVYKRGYILINPVRIDEQTWEITDRFGEKDDWARIVESVIHEFTHAVGCRWHDAEFASRMGELYIKVLMNAEDLQELHDSFYGV